MQLHYEGQQSVDGSVGEVFRFICDAHNVGPCTPDLVDLDVLDAAHFHATVKVGVGPVKGKLKLEVALLPQEEQHSLTLTIHGSGMGSGVDLTASAALTPSDVSHTVMDWQANGSVSGPLATVGGRLLDKQAQRIIEQVFVNVRDAVNRLVNTSASEEGTDRSASGGGS
ncbi:MAG: carbon monoxide dehydrogenase subunit G [Firmicutes bacterium]|nr:carbon monoxide dehydrogenase subunit G [Bacillota bacterium]